MKTEFIELEINGTQLRIATLQRQGRRAPIVFLHGFGSTKEDYADITRFSQFDDRAVIAFDAPGFGQSECTDLSVISIAFLREVAERVIAHFELSHFHLVGHSMGGLTGLLLAHCKPSSVLSFTNIEGNLHPEDCFLSRQIIEHAEHDQAQFMASFVARVSRAPYYSCALYASSLPHKVRVGAVEPIFRSMVELSDGGDLLEKFVQLPCPKQYMYGDASPMPSYLGILQDQGVQLAKIPFCHHFPMYANPPAMWMMIDDFIDQVESAGKLTQQLCGTLETVRQNDHEFFNLEDATQGIARELAPGINTRIFVGDNAMISIVDLEPNVEGPIHSHPEEQWGVLLEGDAVRIQGGREVAVRVGDFWRTPGGVPHGMRAGTKGARVLDVFSPPREEYKKAGKGFSTA